MAAAARITAGLSPPLPPQAEHGTSWRPTAAVQIASYTGAAAGGAPGANFGAPGAAVAPVPSSGFSLLPILGAAAVGLVLFMVLD